MNIQFFKFLFLITLFSFFGCAQLDKESIKKEEIREEHNISKNIEHSNKPAIEIIEVSAENFSVQKADLPETENIMRAKILGASLNDVVALLTEATNQNIIVQAQTKGTGISGANVYLSTSDIEFGRLLKKTVGDKLSIRYDDETYYLGYEKTVTIKIPSVNGLAAAITGTISTLGATRIAHDSITSSLTFSAREKEYKDIMDYLTMLRNNLYVIEYNIAIYDVELNDNYSLGIDWNLAMQTATIEFAGNAPSIGALPSGGTPATFGTILNMPTISGEIMADMLSEFGKVESIQKPKLLGLAGTKVTLTDGLSEPYISGLTTSSVGNGGIQTSTTSASALSGLNITLKSNMMDETVLTEISIQVNDVVGYSNFKVGDTSYSQPKTRTKNINNTMRVKPGVPIVISGLFRHTLDKGYKGLPGLAGTKAQIIGGGEHEGNNKSEMVIVVTPRVIKYVMK